MKMYFSALQHLSGIFSFLKEMNVKTIPLLWLTFLTLAVIFLLSMQFNAFNLNKLINNNLMKYRIENHRLEKHKIEKILEDALLKLKENKAKGIVVMEFIPTFNEGTEAIPNYRGEVSYLVEYDATIDKVINTSEIRLKADKVRIDYLEKVSLEMQKHSNGADGFVSLSVAEMASIDPVRMNAMWVNKTIVNGIVYTGNFNFEVERSDFAFIKNNENDIVGQMLFIMDKDYSNNSNIIDRKIKLTKARDDVKNLFNKN